MSPQEAAQLLAAFAAAFGKQVDETTAEVWYQSTLCQVDYQLALRVADRLVSQDTWFPTPARFNEVRRAVVREMGLQPHKALPSPAPDQTERQRVAALIAETRERLRAPKREESR